MSKEVTSFLNMNHIYFPLQTLGTITSLVGFFGLGFLFGFGVFLHSKYWGFFVLIEGICQFVA